MIRPLVFLLFLSSFYVFYNRTRSTDTCIISEASSKNLHHVFSTDCSPYHDWQSVGLIESWLNLNKPHSLTRLISCEGPLPDRILKMKQVYPEVNFVQVKTAKEFTGDDYGFLNKPTSVHQWILSYDFPEEFVVVTDPDWVLLQPFDIRGCKKGHPLTAYGIAPFHLASNPTWRDICGKYCLSTNIGDYAGYDVGHVYVAHKDDMKQLAVGWTNWTLKIRERQDIQRGGHMVDMYGYQLSALELGLKHEIRPYFDLSHPDDPKTRHVTNFQALHYCQSLTFNGVAWSKHNLRTHNPLQCNSTYRLKMPPYLDEMSLFSLRITVPRFYLTLAGILNRAFASYKKKVCQPDQIVLDF